MEVTLEEAYKMTKQHNEETNVQLTHKGDEKPENVLQQVLDALNSTDYYNVSISHPLITYTKFKHAMQTFEYYCNNSEQWQEKGLWASWAPEINTLSFWRTKEQMQSFLSTPIDEKYPEYTFGHISNFFISGVTLQKTKAIVKYLSGEEVDVEFDTIKDNPQL